jgi:hypothetical protein
MTNHIKQTIRCAALFIAVALLPVLASADDRIEGRVEGGGLPIAKADVTLWAAGSGAPRKLAVSQTGDDGKFDMTLAGERKVQVCFTSSPGGRIPRSR